MIKLISEIDLQEHTDITESFKEKAFDIVLGDAQELDLKPLLGTHLYLDIIQNPTTYTDILEPKIWTYDSKTYSHQGLKKVLALFVASRYYQGSTSISTPFGNRLLNNDYSAASPEKEVARKAGLAQSSALSYFNDIKLFLNQYATTYTLWNTCETENQSMQPIKMRAVGKSYDNLRKFKNWDR